MSELLSISNIDELYNVVALLAPGFIVTFVRNQFLTGRTRTISETTMEYIIVSVVFYALAIPLIPHLSWMTDDKSILLVLVLPALIGIILGAFAQLEVLSRLLNCGLLSWTGLKIAHPIPTSWDYVFANLKTGVWVLVTLKSGERIHGLFGGQSFASSDLSRRDLYIEDIRKEDWSALESDGRTRGIWLSEEEIRLIEIIPAGVTK